MDTQTESAGCFEKATKNGEPTFTLRAQDITAPAFVRLWCEAQLWLRQQVEAGVTVDDAVLTMADRFRRVFADTKGEPTEGFMKRLGATEIAHMMLQWHGTKKIAD